MESIKKLQISIFIKLAIVDVVLVLLSLILIEKPLPFIIGLIFGSLISALNFVELANTLTHAVYMPPSKAQTFTTAKYFIRYIVTAVVLYVSIVAPYINVLGTIVGLVSIKLIIMVTNLMSNKQYFSNIFKRKEDESSGQ